jgi:hypothetical protein
MYRYGRTAEECPHERVRPPRLVHHRRPEGIVFPGEAVPAFGHGPLAQIGSPLDHHPGGFPPGVGIDDPDPKEGVPCRPDHGRCQEPPPREWGDIRRGGRPNGYLARVQGTDQGTDRRGRASRGGVPRKGGPGRRGDLSWVGPSQEPCPLAAQRGNRRASSEDGDTCPFTTHAPLATQSLVLRPHRRVPPACSWGHGVVPGGVPRVQGGDAKGERGHPERGTEGGWAQRGIGESSSRGSGRPS